ncbi:tRNA pseudouridine(55) synthase TruB [Nautilia sp. PV-1]|nr:tRNA pseudouridine(55) synthase TruB [Nautilia sp. PV-1]
MHNQHKNISSASQHNNLSTSQRNIMFVANKPMFVSSNKFLNRLKRKYGIKKMGFSGTLDPFACGCLIIASGQYTKLFRFLKKTPKTYLATLMLGAYSQSLDIEKIEKIENIEPFEKEKIIETLNSFKGIQKQLPPKYSAKRINGQRAYNLIENGELRIENNISQNVYLEKKVDIEIFDIELINYSHPFITFKASVSEGTYIRSLGFDIAKKLGVNGALTYLERLNEGKFHYECEKPLNPIEYLDLEENSYENDIENLILGRKLNINDFKIKKNGKYYVKFDKFFAIIEIESDKVSYILNRIELC